MAVGRDVSVPAGATVVDLGGRYVMPGIIDTHSHTAIEGNVNECSDSVTAEVRVADVIDDRDIDIYRQLAGGVTAINVLHGSCNTIGGQNAVLKMRWGLPPDQLLFEGAPRGIKFALGENPKRSNFRVPGEPPRYPATRMGVEVVLRESFAAARDYKREWEAYEAKVKALPAKAERPVPPRRDLRLETLRDILDGKIYVHSHAYRADEILMLLEGRRRVRLQDPDRAARPGGLQGRARARPARGGGGHLHRLVGLQARGLRRHPLQPRDPPEARRPRVLELRLRRAGAAPLLGRGQGGEVRRGVARRTP